MIGVCERCSLMRVIRLLFYKDNNKAYPIKLCHDCESFNDGYIAIKPKVKKMKIVYRRLYEKAELIES